jgi:hypothetical protein
MVDGGLHGRGIGGCRQHDSMPTSRPVVFRLDADNTLTDHDRVFGDVMLYSKGNSPRNGRSDTGNLRRPPYGDRITRLRRCLAEVQPQSVARLHVLDVSSYRINHPFANRLFPRYKFALIVEPLRLMSAVRSAAAPISVRWTQGGAVRT